MLNDLSWPKWKNCLSWKVADASITWHSLSWEFAPMVPHACALVKLHIESKLNVVMLLRRLCCYVGYVVLSCLC